MLQKRTTQSPESQLQGLGIWSPEEVILPKRPEGQEDKEEPPRWWESAGGEVEEFKLLSG